MVSEHFKAWVDSDEAKAEQPWLVQLGSATRYEFAIYVDTASLERWKDLTRESPYEHALTKYPYVNTIDGLWEPLPVDEETPDDPDDPKVDVGWTVIRVNGLIPSIY
jgi:hypothetical protein